MSSAHHHVGSRAFNGFLTAQFLGAFNDNYFKQLVLLICVAGTATGGVPWKEIAMAAFALPFVLFSGIGGFLSDRCSKRSVIVGCKIAEILIVAAGMLLLLIPSISESVQLASLIAMLALMGTHSAIFSPSKYGILPELFPEAQLRPVNGAVQMTTFLAIIFGMVAAGVALDEIGGKLWVGSLLALLPALLGTLAAVLIPKGSAAEPGLPLQWSNLFLPASVLTLLRSNRDLQRAIAVSALFWFLGGVTQMSVTTLGEKTLALSSTRTSVLAAGMGIGIAAGCIVAGFLGRPGSGGVWTVAGAWLLVVSMSLVALLGSGIAGQPASAGIEGHTESILQRLLVADALEWMLRASMILLGFAAGIFVVPVQVYLQQAPPADLKGRLLGVQNLATWIGILLSAAYSFLIGSLLKFIDGEKGDEKFQWAMFLTLAVMLVPVGLFYRLPERPTAKMP